jgi:membrane associated rhomboid family serine protease
MQRFTINEDEYTASDYTTSTGSNTLSTSEIPLYFSNENPPTPTAQPIQGIPTVISSTDVSCINDNISPISSVSPIRNRFRQYIYDIESLEEEEEEDESFHSIYTSNTIDYLNERFKLFTFSITTILILCHFTDIGGDDVYDDYNLMMGVISPWPECKDNRSLLWKLFSNILIHSSDIHLFGNIFMFFIFSYLVEQYQYSSRVASVFFIGVMHGNLILYYVQPYSYGIGASHGSFTMLGAFVSHLIINHDLYPKLTIAFSSILSSLFIVNEYLVYDESNNVSYISHWTGCVSGFIGGLSIFHYYIDNDSKQRVRLCAILSYLIMTSLLFYNYINNYPPLQSYNNVLEKVETKNCCYELFLYQHENPNSDLKDFECPYTVRYNHFFNN